MKVCLDVAAALQQTAGIGRYTASLAHYLPRVAPEHALELFSNAATVGSRPIWSGGRPVRSVGIPNKPWRVLLLLSQGLRVPLDLLVPPADVFHATDLVFPHLRGAAVVTTVHDLSFLLFPGFHRPGNRWNSRLAATLMARRADAILAVSESTKRDIVHLLGVAPERVVVTPLGVDGRYEPRLREEARALVERRLGVAGPYLLAVSTIEPRKNLDGLLAAYELLLANGRELPPLLIAGKPGWRNRQFFARLASSPARERVVLGGFVSEDDLPWLYAGAEVFVYPSFYEGFGLPVLEAMACGAPIICSNTSSLPEVAGDAALLVDPSRLADLAAAIARVLDDPELRGRLSRVGVERAAGFRWEDTARRTVQAYGRAVEGRARRSR